MENIFWVYQKQGQHEKLLRIKTHREFYSLGDMNEGSKASQFIVKEPEVIIQKQSGLRAASRFSVIYSLRILINVGLVIFVLGVWSVKNLKDEKKEKQAVLIASPSVVSYPKNTEPVFKPSTNALRKNSIPKRKELKLLTKKTSKKRSWIHTKTKLRQAFQKGDFFKAQAIILSIREKGNGKIPSALSELVSEVYYALCRASFINKKWREAVKYCEEALGIRSHSKARNILKQLSSLTRKTYFEGYVMENLNRSAAISRFKLAIRMAPSGDPYGYKARKRLKKFKKNHALN